MRKCVNWLIFSAVGVILALGAFIFNFWILPLLVNYQVGKTMALDNGTMAWDMFLVTPIPMYFKVYFFNIENPEGIVRGEKPKVKEVGPYVYREYREKHDVSVNTVNDTISYHQGMKFIFDAEKSHPRSDNDKVSLMNFAIHLISQVVDSLEYPVSLVNEIVESALSELLQDKYGTTITFSVKEILFDGFLLNCTNSNSTTVKTVCSALKHFPKIKIISETEDGNLLAAILRFKNTSYDGLFEINRGVRDFASIGKILSWEKKTKLDNWGGDYCNSFTGSYDVTLMPPFVTKDTKFKLYSTDICTTAPVEYYGDTEFQGISGMRFKTTSYFMANKTEYPKNACYCPGSIGNLTTPADCSPTGALDLSTCMNIPALISYPHLLHANPYYHSLIDGLSPNSSLHETYMDLEPTTGIPLRGYKRFQLNIYVKPNSAIRLIENISYALVPIMWFEEGAELGDAQVSMLRDQLLKVLNIANIVKWVLIACGVCMALVGIGMAIWNVRKTHYHPD